MTDIKEYLDENGVVKISLIVQSNAPAEDRKKIIKDNPVSIYEVFMKETGKTRLTKIINYADENGHEDLIQAVLNNDNEAIKQELIVATTKSKGINRIPYCKDLKSFGKAIKEIRENAYKWIDEFDEARKKEEWLASERKRIQMLSAHFDRSFFAKLEKQFDKVDYAFEYAVIKLVSKLESIYKSYIKDEQNPDLEELINRFSTDEHERNLLHKLRITRNNYLHPRKEEFEFSREKFRECLEIIFSKKEG